MSNFQIWTIDFQASVSELETLKRKQLNKKNLLNRDVLMASESKGKLRKLFEGLIKFVSDINQKMVSDDSLEQTMRGHKKKELRNTAREYLSSRTIKRFSIRVLTTRENEDHFAPSGSKKHAQDA